MKEIYQKTDSDCQKCSLCFLLNKNYDEVPDFTDGMDKYNMSDSDKDLFDERLDVYLKSLGLFRLDVEVNVNEKGLLYLPYSSFVPMQVIGVLKKKDTPFSHAVVLDVSNKNARILFDPKKDSDYEIKDITHVEYILKYFK